MSNTSISIKKILDTFTAEQWEKIAAYAAGKAREKRGDNEPNNAMNDNPAPVEKKQLTEKELYVKISDILHEISIPANIKGYGYLREAVILAYEDRNYVEGVTKILYPTIAKKFGTTSSRVERAIRHAVEKAFEMGDMDLLHKYFTYSYLRGKPTNSETIASLAEYLKLQ